MACSRASFDGRPWIVLIYSQAFFGSVRFLESALSLWTNVIPVPLHYREWVPATGILPDLTRLWLRTRKRLSLDLQPWIGPMNLDDIDLVVLADPIPLGIEFPGYRGYKGLLALDPQIPSTRERHASLTGLEDYDFVFCSQRDYLPFYREHGASRVMWLPHGADPVYHHPADGPRSFDIAFAGSNYGGRQQLLDHLRTRFRVHQYTAFLHDLSSLYGRAKVVFNKAWYGEVNMRVFEATASGALLLTDRILNGLGDLFRVGDEIAVYGSSEEMVELADYYLNDSDARDTMARKGMARCQRDHTYQMRAQELLRAVGMAPSTEGFQASVSS